MAKSDKVIECLAKDYKEPIHTRWELLDIR